ncbi:hypothetical protein [Pollutibacter soli]|uniref:hypothetical protein n=1 Tax=Pollutibacter soli TaxID=3034157 RepID=UPI003013E606
MKKYIYTATLSLLFCGLLTFIGSVIGFAFGNTILFAGAFVGGAIGIFSSLAIAAKVKLIEQEHRQVLFLSGLVFFSIAVLFAVTNLGSPVIPLLSLLLVPVGIVAGMYILETTSREDNLLRFLISAIVITPVCYFVIGSIVTSELGIANSFTLIDWIERSSIRKSYFNFFSPMLFIGGIVVAVALNLTNTQKKFNIPFLKTINLRIASLPQLILISISVLMFTVLTAYVVVEKIHHF